MPRISVVPHPPTLSFYRTALRATRLAPPNPHAAATAASAASAEDAATAVAETIASTSGGLATPLAHLQRKLRYNIRDGISIYRQERGVHRIQELISGAEQDLAMIQAWKHVDPLWLERIFKKPTSKKNSSRT